ncbi:MAG: zinc-binding dehydrogenase [Actinobacteria bacterium]|nr:zinc-binding dehydrogenase [Actinomycetota bacterium]
MKGRMKAQLFYGPGDVRYEEIDIPEISPGEALVRIRSALTCGSDLKTYKRGHPTMIKKGSVFGHEWAGDIVETAGDVTAFKAGDRVVAMNSAPCFYCYYCKLERYSMCENIVYNNGAYAEYIKIPENILKINTIKLPEHLSYREAALTEPLACVVHGIDLSGITEGDIIAINGAGPIGLLWIVLAKLKGARVIATDLSEERLAVAEGFGADFTVSVSSVQDQVEAVKKLTDGKKGVDVAVDATGFPDVWEKALKMGRKGAVISLFGGCPSGTSINMDTGLIHYSELTVTGVYHHTPYYVKKAFKLIENRQVDAEKFITADMPLEKLIDALELMGRQKGIKYNIVS